MAFYFVLFSVASKRLCGIKKLSLCDSLLSEVGPLLLIYLAHVRFSGKQFFLKNLDVLYKTHTCRGAERSASPVAGVAAAHRKACDAASGGLQGRGGLSLGSVQAEGVGRGWQRNRAPSPAVTPPRGPVLPRAWRAGVPRTPAAALPRSARAHVLRGRR